MYAIVKVGGKQYRVEKGDSVVVDRLSEDAGATVALEPLLFRSDDDAVFDRGGLEKVKVEAVVAGHERGKKVHVLKFKPKRGYKRRLGHRSDLTRLEIQDIKLLSRKPARKKSAAKTESKEAAGDSSGAAAGRAKARGKAGTAKASGAKSGPRGAAAKQGGGQSRKKTAGGKRAAGKKEAADGS